MVCSAAICDVFVYFYVLLLFIQTFFFHQLYFTVKMKKNVTKTDQENFLCPIVLLYRYGLGH